MRLVAVAVAATALCLLQPSGPPAPQVELADQTTVIDPQPIQATARYPTGTR